MFACVICTFVAKTQEEAYGHLKAHSKCMLCEFKAANLRSHFNTHIKPFRCDLCPYAGSQKAHLTKHKEHHQPNHLARWHCPYCSFCHLDPHQVDHLYLHGWPHEPPDQQDQPAKRQKVEEVPAAIFVNSKEEDGFIILETFPRLSLSASKDVRPIVFPIHNEENELPHPTKYRPADMFLEKLADIYWHGDKPSLVTSIFNTTVTVGRTKNVPNYEIDVNLECDTVTRLHLMIKADYDTVAKKITWIAKSFGRNGSYINGQFLARGKRYITDGTIFQCGSSPQKFRLQINPAGVQRATAFLTKRHELAEAARQAALAAWDQ